MKKICAILFLAMTTGCAFAAGTLSVSNLRCEYMAAPLGIDNRQPRFTYHGFRFVEVDGLTHKPQLSTLTGKVIASSSPATGWFETSDRDVNKLWENIRWTQLGNMISVPTDCPQRDEREGWTADTQIFSQTAIYNLDMAGFYSKWA